VAEADAGDGRFVQEHGPFVRYERTLVADGTTLHETIDYRLVLPWFRWLFAPFVRRTLRHRPASGRLPWWSPPDRLDARQTLVLGLLAAGSVLVGFINTLFTQTVHRATDEFGVGESGQGVAATVVRLGIVLAIPLWFLADRVGRRRVMVAAGFVAPVVAAIGAAAPSFALLTLTQAIARPTALTVELLIAVVGAETVPRNSRAYTLSLLAMSSGLGAGLCVMALPLADLGPSAWRIIYLLPLVLLVVSRDLWRRLPETARFEQHRGEPARRVRGRRFWILVAVAACGNIFVAPASVFQNRYLEDVRGFSNTLISAFTLGTQTPGGLGLLIGGKLADLRGRRKLAVGCLLGATALYVWSYATGGPTLWMVSITGAVLGGLAYPALAVYRTELFPTGSRGLGGGLVTASALGGGAIGLLIAGQWLESASYVRVMGTLSLGTLIVAAIVLTSYPETAHQELEDINPEDRTPAPRPDGPAPPT
jgi:predicted MFS family arabinose efflux permease